MSVELVVSLAVGVSLAASAGLRAFLPLLVTGLAARYDVGMVELGTHFAWLESTPALVALGVATAVEVIGDKVPAVDHVLDVLQAPVRTAAGMLAMAAVAPGELPIWLVTLGSVVAGGGAAASVHTGKALVRAGSTATTGGVANPLLSVGEDVVAVVVPLLAILLAVCAVAFAVGIVWVIWRVLRGRRVAP